MPTIDDKVVAISFESSQFEAGVNNAIRAIDKLNAALKFPEAGKGLDSINRAAQGVQLGHISSAVDEIKNKFSALSVAALAVFANIAQKAVSAGANLVKAFTLDPVKAGFQEYATNLNAIQTILANTQASGATLDDVNAALLDLNKYSDKTIYNFSEMAKNIGTFTAAGVGLKPATQAIKGIANLAALSGSNSQQASTAMYQLSQAIAAGRVSLQDWNSVVNAGMGGTVFQRALANTAVAMGTLKDSSLKLVGPMKNVSINGEAFRQSITAKPGEKSWLTSDVLTKTLSQFTGDLTNAQLKAQGFNDAQIKAIQQTAKTAMHAATEVKTLSQVLDVAKETAGSGWAQTWQIIFGNFGEAKSTFTALSNTINGFINKNAEARNKVLADWKALGGRTVLIDGIKTAFHNLGLIIAPIKEAFRDIFPPTTGKQLYDLTQRFHAFAEALKPSPATVDGLKRTFEGLFALLDIGKQIVSGILGVFGKVFHTIAGGSGSFLEITAKIGDFLVALDESLKKGDSLKSFFDGLAAILIAPLKMLGKLADALRNLFGGFSAGGFSQQISGMTQSLSPFQRIMQVVSTAWHNFIAEFGKSKQILQPAVDAIVQLLQGLGPAISSAISGMNFEAILQVIRTGLLGGIVLLLKNFFGKGSFLEQVSKGLGGGIIQNIAGSFKALEGSMVAMQNNIKADTLEKIAIAIGILTASIVALSFVDPKKLNSALVGIGIAFGQLLGAMAIMDKIGKSGGFIKMPFIAGSMILLAGAIDILSIAVIALSKLSWGDLLKGLGGVGALLVGIVAASGPLSANSAGMIRAGIGITAIAVAMKILASAVADFGGMSWTEIGKGLIGVAGGLGAIVAAMKFMPTGLLLQGAGLVAIAAGLKILASAVAQFGGMDWGTIGKGMAGIGAGLVIIAAAMRLMPTNLPITAAGLVLVSFALKGIVAAVQSMGGMSVTAIAKGLISLAGALTILAVALYAMSGTLTGAAALGIAAAGIALLAPALATLGKQSWTEIIKGFIALAGAITILGVASALLTPVIPEMIGLGAALVLIGGGLALAGAGIALIGTGLSAIAIAGPTAIGILLKALEDFVAAIPKIAKDTVLGFLQIVKAVAATAPQFVDALLKIINSLVDAVIRSMPKLTQAFDALITAAITVLRNNQGKIIQAGFDLIVALLQGIKNNINAIVTEVTAIITKFLGAITSNLGKIIAAGEKILESLLKGIANAIGDIVASVAAIYVKFLSAIANNLPKIVAAGLSILVNLLEGIASGLGKVIKAGTDIIVGFINGVGEAGPRVITAAVNTMIKFINAIEQNSVKLINAGMQAIVNFLNGVAAAINAHSGEMRSAGMNVGIAIIDGMTGGLASAGGRAISEAANIGRSVIHALGKAVKFFSPSKEAWAIGEGIAEGLALGMDKNTQNAEQSATVMGQGVITAMNAIFETASPSKVMYRIGQFVTQGFAQGLRSGSDEIRSSFTDLNTKLQDAMRDAREKIKEENTKVAQLMREQQDKIDELNKEKFKKEQDKVDKIREIQAQYAEPIAKAQAVIKENEALLAQASATHTTLIKALSDEKVKLITLSNQYDRLADKLKAARGHLADLRKERAQAIAGFQEQFAEKPDLSGPMTQEIQDARDKIAAEQAKLDEQLAKGEQDPQAIVDAQNAVAQAQSEFDTLISGKVLDTQGKSVDILATYVKSLKAQTDSVSAYSATLQQLRKLGLDDDTYQKLLAEGTADQQFATQLLSGGKDAVESLNTLDANLDATSKRLAVNAGNNLYAAGVAAAEGFINGLESKSDKLHDAIVRLANRIVNTLKKQLKIKSPSEIFAEIGQFSMEGMAKGMTESSQNVSDAAEQAAKDALLAMKKTMTGVNTAISEHIDPNPVITPILDLTQVKAQAQQLSTLTTPSIPITTATSYKQAATISSTQTAAQAEEAAVIPGGTSVKFEQNNYSPESLSTIEIYRQTKNQLSQLKTALALT